MKTYTWGIAMLTALLAPAMVFAGPVVRSGESVTVGSGQVVEEDFYAAAGTVTISGEIRGDAYIASRSLTVNAPVGADVAVVGGIVQLHAPVADDVRVVGGEAVLADRVEGDVVVIGGILRVLSTASVGGDIIFWGGELVIEGAVEGSVFGFAQTARFDSSVGGNVELRAEKRFVLGDRAEVLGNITYTGTNEIERAQNAVVVGNIQTEKIEGAQGVPVQFFFVTLFAVLFAALTTLLIFRRYIEETVSDPETAYGLWGLIGLAVFLGFPFVSAILMLSVLGFLAGLFLLASYIAILIISWIVLGAAIGAYAMRALTKRGTTSVVSVVLGICLLHVIVYVPFIGPLVAFAGLLIALGAVSLRLYRAFI